MIAKPFTDLIMAFLHFGKVGMSSQVHIRTVAKYYDFMYCQFVCDQAFKMQMLLLIQMPPLPPTGSM
jgi:hypothetical protein